MDSGVFMIVKYILVLMRQVVTTSFKIEYREMYLVDVAYYYLSQHFLAKKVYDFPRYRVNGFSLVGAFSFFGCSKVSQESFYHC